MKTIGDIRLKLNHKTDAALADPTVEESITSVSIHYRTGSSDNVEALTEQKEHTPAAYDFLKPFGQFVADEIAAIKTAEGIV